MIWFGIIEFSYVIRDVFELLYYSFVLKHIGAATQYSLFWNFIYKLECHWNHSSDTNMIGWSKVCYRNTYIPSASNHFIQRIRLFCVSILWKLLVAIRLFYKPASKQFWLIDRLLLYSHMVLRCFETDNRFAALWKDNGSSLIHVTLSGLTDWTVVNCW